MVNTERGAEVKNLRVITWDQVIYPSHPGAYTQRLVTESAGYANENDLQDRPLIIPINNQDVINYIKSESTNLKTVRESFDFAYNNIQVNEDATKVTLTNGTGDIFVINLESYIGNEIRNYASNKIIY